uniref:Uncharacterized protein n=1 Tax=Anguilla anguilla TaxID=7936 RepID=A0A0E9TD28_ANGAN
MTWHDIMIGTGYSA